MSSDIRIKLSDFDAELLANIAEREGRTPEAVVLEALHELFSERLEEKSFLISKDEFEACLAILSEPAADADCLFFRLKTIMNARALTAFACAIAALASLGSVPAAAGERLDNIVKNNTLRVGTPGDYRPFAMKEDSGYAGHDIDVVKAMAEVYGWKVEFVPTTWKQMAADLKDNRFDVAVGGITRSPARALTADFLPAYAPFGKVALVNVKMKNKFRTLDDLNQPDVRVIKNPGGTNEAFVLANLTRAKVSTHDKNFEIPGLIAEGRGDVMITENAEAKLYAKKDKRLHAAFLENPLTPVNYMGFMLPVDDPDYTRVMNYLWDLLDRRGELKSIEAKWLD